MLTGKKVVVTGGAGFIGSHLVDALVEAGIHVIIIDDLSTGNIKNIEHHLGASRSPRVEFIHATITDLPLLQNLFKGIDYVFHQAAIPSVPRSIDNPVASHEANLTGTLNVLLAARDNRVKKVVYASSSAVYGDTPIQPKREDMIPHPQSPYAVTKLAAEYYCSIFTRVYGLPAACLRYFNVYGPRQDPDSQYAAVIPKFIKLILEGKPPAIYGDGEQTRDFAFVKDVVSANLLAAETGAAGVFNIGRGERLSLNGLASLMLSRLSKNGIKPVHEQERLGDIKHSLADISKARAFGYKPEYTVEKGIEETIPSFKNGN